MKALTLLQTPMELRDTPGGGSLSSNYSPPCVENKLLLATPSLMLLTTSSCPALQPTGLSSTSSTLLPVVSPLLSTQNRLLNASNFLTPANTILTSAPLLSGLSQPPSFLLRPPGLDGGAKREVAEDTGGEEVSQCSPEDEEEEEEEMVPDEGETLLMEAPVLHGCDGQEDKHAAASVQEEFTEMDGTKERAIKEMEHQKYLLLNAVCCSLVNKSTAPGQKDWDAEDSIWTRITNLAKTISEPDPQFLLKVAVYTRQELNIRITANFLLALAASLPAVKCHLRRYFCAAVQLPSDWLEVVRIYSTCFSRSLPSCLKKAMADKFKQFGEYQLAKYNTRQHRCKHNRNRRDRKKPSDEQLKRWAQLLSSDEGKLKKYLKVKDGKAVDKKQQEFSLKKMIKLLHIKEPAEHVMAILGRKYPADPKAFTYCGMSGVWDRERAGRRMKLKEPETWERLLSQEGNTAAAWEKLIDNRSLPFMAMLRNLRNIIIQGVSEAHHQKIISRLTSKKAVVQSRQFPFRFLAAYKVVMELRRSGSKKKLPADVEIQRAILKKSLQSRRVDWAVASRKRTKAAMGVPFIRVMFLKKKRQLLLAQRCAAPLLDRYCKALETAVQISCRHNVPPLPGRTVILLNTETVGFRRPCLKTDFCLPRPPQREDEANGEDEGSQRGEKKDQDEDLTPSVMEVLVLLSLMIATSAEDTQIALASWNGFAAVELKSDVLLDNVRAVMEQIKELAQMSSTEDADFLSRLFSKTNKVDNIIMLNDSWNNDNVSWAVQNYRKEVNAKALLINILVNNSAVSYSSDSQCVELTGFSEQMLRFVAERGSSRLLDHVEHLDRVYNIQPPEGAKDKAEATKDLCTIPAIPKLRWRGVRVFISSTFRDMHAERDVLVRSVFPELRRRAALHCLHLQEVELRWGVTEEESERAVELCLSEVCRSQMLVAILGERYGLVPPRPQLPDLPQYSWLTSAPEGLSVTEMEIRQFQALHRDVAHSRIFCYFRDPNIVKSVPAAWRSDFAPESKEAASKMASLKSWIQDSNAKVTENYPCEWGGVVEGKPYLKNLENFGKAVLEDLWKAVTVQFVEASEATDASEQEVHQASLRRNFFGRAKLLSAAVETVRKVQVNGGVVVVEGAAGQGKTVFMAALADALRTRVGSGERPDFRVISYSTAASRAARSAENLLHCLLLGLRDMKGAGEQLPSVLSYRDLLLKFHAALKVPGTGQPLVFMVDGADLVRDAAGQPTSDWIPQHLPKGVCCILSVASNSMLLQALAKSRGIFRFALGQLTMSDRREIVQKGLDAFGKRLSDSAFNNQLQTLTMKKGAESPLYLHLACQDLRSYATFDKLKESLQVLPSSLNQLVRHCLERLLSQHRDVPGLGLALAVLTISPAGLRERDLYSVLNTCNQLPSTGGRLAWQEVLRLSRKPGGRVPMATFAHIVQHLKSLTSPSHLLADDLLALNNHDVKRAFEDLLLPTEADHVDVHLILAAHLWTLADPRGEETFLHCEAEAVEHLSSSLVRGEQPEVLRSLLSSYYFLYANVRHGLLRPLLETYGLFEDVGDALEDCRGFLRRHAALLASWPALFPQQALNEPQTMPASVWARGLLGDDAPGVVVWHNNSRTVEERSSELVSTFLSEPTCLAVNGGGEMMVVGTGRGTLHVIHAQTGQEVKSLASSCDGISSCVFLTDGLVSTTSFDGQIEIWDVHSGRRTELIKGHAHAITASDATADRKHLATASLDQTLKVWSSAKGREVASLQGASPFNCVCFDPEDRLLAAGCWDGGVIVWNWLRNETRTVLRGHRRSVRSLSFSPSSSTLCSGSVSGEVRVWSVAAAACVGHFKAHRGAADALAFLEDGRMLVTAGADHALQLWSGGLGCAAGTLKTHNCEQEPPQKKSKTSIPELAALCAVVHGDNVAVGYHEGLRLFSLESGEMIWAAENLEVSVPSLLWAGVGEETLLVSAGSDGRLRVWEQEDGAAAGLRLRSMSGVQPGVINAMAHNATHLATASESFTVTLRLLVELGRDVSAEPQAELRGHTGGITCLAFRPDGGALLSGGKDQALMLWDVTCTPPLQSKVLPNAHRDWITGCAWAPDCAVSSSNDGRLCTWDLQAGRCLREIPWIVPLTSVCCPGDYVMAGCADGKLHVWSRETGMEICHIGAHEQRINHCSLLPGKGLAREVDPEEVTVLTASNDGTVRIWKPLQVEHLSTLGGHTGSIHSVARKEGTPEILTVSADRSLRCWRLETENPPSAKSPVAVLCFSATDDVLLAGYESGLLELWQRGGLVGRKQASECAVCAACPMPDGRFAVSYCKPLVDVWEVVWNQHHSAANLKRVTTYDLPERIVRLSYSSVLLGVSDQTTIYKIDRPDGKSCTEENKSYHKDIRVLGMIPNDEKSVWLVGEHGGAPQIGFILALGSDNDISVAFSSMTLDEWDKDEAQGKHWITAITVDKDLVVCGDVTGNVWFSEPPGFSSWSRRKPAHSGRVSALRLTGSCIITASFDHTVKMWDRSSKKQVGMFVCGGPVLALEVNPENPSRLVCGDGEGRLYFLSWRRRLPAPDPQM